eukprot:74602_1
MSQSLPYIMCIISITMSVDLDKWYNASTMLEENMTYYVTQDVMINADIFVVPKNVHIIFTANYTISVSSGSFFMGCNSQDTESVHDIGTISNQISIYHNQNDTKNGNFILSDDSDARFCNVEFINLYNAITVLPTSQGKLVADNCLFDGNHQDIYVSTVCDNWETFCYTNSVTISDNVFTSSNNAIYLRTGTIEHNIFYDTKFIAINVPYQKQGNSLIINNNTFTQTENMNATAIYMEHSSSGTWVKNGLVQSTITHNTFIKWVVAIQLLHITCHACDPALLIQFNIFIQNEYAIEIIDGYHQIHFNNFIHNSISIKLLNKYDRCAQPTEYNYYGVTTNDSLIIAKQILDTCQDGGYIGYVHWWPWYTEIINHKLLPSLSKAVNLTSTSIACSTANNHNSSHALYFRSVTLTASDSPYYISHHIMIEGDLIVAPNVSIIFTGNYILYVHGSLSMGSVDTTDKKIVGIVSPQQRIMMQNDGGSSSQSGTLMVEGIVEGNYAHIYNVEFFDLHSVQIFGYAVATISNCEFYDNAYGIFLSGKNTKSNNSHIISNNKFYNVMKGIYFNAYKYSLIENNIFEVIYYGVIMNGPSIIYNNTFQNRGTGISHTYDSWYDGSHVTNITHNSFKALDSGIELKFIRKFPAHIKFNNFIDNKIAISIDQYTTTHQHINYNNFWNNQYNIELNNDMNQSFCNYNWNGFVHNITDPRNIAIKMLDSCDSNTYLGIINFSPYFSQPLSFNHSQHFENSHLYGFDINNCSFINQTGIVARLITQSPSMFPTMNPTRNPTMNPTTANPTTSPTNTPTSSPTQLPTTSPTQLPTANPTPCPTISPTTPPTKVPTENPTISPTKVPTDNPTVSPTSTPTASPTKAPTTNPTTKPTAPPTEPTLVPTREPSLEPTVYPTYNPTKDPTTIPTGNPTVLTEIPTTIPTTNPTGKIAAESLFNDNLIMRLSLIIVGVALFICCICLVFACVRNIKRIQDAANDNINLLVEEQFQDKLRDTTEFMSSYNRIDKNTTSAETVKSQAYSHLDTAGKIDVVQMTEINNDSV